MILDPIFSRRLVGCAGRLHLLGLIGPSTERFERTDFTDERLRPLMEGLGWMMLVWAASVTALGVVVGALRWWLKL